MKRGKKYVEAAKAIDRGTLYDVADAVALVKKTAVAKFDETIEAHIRTGCDGRHADQQIRRRRRAHSRDPERELVRIRRSCSYTRYDGCCWTSRTCTWT